MATIKNGAKRPRNAWFLATASVLGVHQMDIFYKNTKGDIGPYSPGSRNASVKIPFGPPVLCEYSVKTVEGAAVGEFKFFNKRRQSAELPEGILYSLGYGSGVTAFSRKVTDIFTDKTSNLLALYLTLLPHSEQFVHHNEELHNKEGFMTDGSGMQERDLVAAGGSLQEFRELAKVAKESAKVVKNVEKGLRDISSYFESTGKRKSKGSSAPKPKISKQAAVDENENKELEDEDGLEVQFQNSYMGLVKVPLANIEISAAMSSLVNPHRVKTIMASIRKWYDPSLNVFVICPEENISLDLKNVGKTRFLAVQKLHTLQAFKEMEKAGDFSQLTGHKSKTVLCYVLKTNKPELVLYGNMRSNEISSQFCRKTRPQDLQTSCTTTSVFL